MNTYFSSDLYLLLSKHNSKFCDSSTTSSENLKNEEKTENECNPASSLESSINNGSKQKQSVLDTNSDSAGNRKHKSKCLFSNSSPLPSNNSGDSGKTYSIPTKAKRKKTVSFSKEVTTPKSEKINRENTPLKVTNERSKMKRVGGFLNFDSFSDDSVFLHKEITCTSSGTTDSFISEECLVLPSTSEFAADENKVVVNSKVKTSSSNSDLSSKTNTLLSEAKDKPQKKHKIKKTKVPCLDLSSKTNTLLSEAKEKPQKKHKIKKTKVPCLEIGEIHSEGNVIDPFYASELPSKKKSSDKTSLIKYPDSNSYEITDIEFNNIDNTSIDLSESYSDFCTTLNNSQMNVSLDDSVYASDIYSQSSKNYSTNPNSSSESMTEIEESYKLSSYNYETLDDFLKSDKILKLRNDNVNNEVETQNPKNKSQNDTIATKLIRHKNKTYVVLKPQSKLYIYGFCSAKVLKGSVLIMGYQLGPDDKPVSIYSPRGSGYLYFETNEENDSKENETLDEVLKENTSLREATHPNDTIICCESIENANMKFMENHISTSFFPKADDLGLRCVFKDSVDNSTGFSPNPEWENINNLNDTDKVFICGGKGVGKSTMLRYCINMLLREHSKILVIDLDPGQPEFTLPGCISAVIVDEPIFGPNYTHIRKTEKSFFISNVNVSGRPQEYLAAMKDLSLFCNNFEPTVTLINYMGFTKGLGIDLASAAIAFFSPTIVVQINSKHYQRNFIKKLRPIFVENKSKFLVPTLETSLNYAFQVINSVSDDSKSDLSARIIRESRVLWYFGSSLTEPTLPVFEVNLSSIQIIYNTEVVAPMVANANFVALCHKESDYESEICIGWGIVRGIDVINDKLYLITPLNSDDLETVDRLVMGSVLLPESIYLSSLTCNGLVPYLSQGVLKTFGEVPTRISDYNKRKNN